MNSDPIGVVTSFIEEFQRRAGLVPDGIVGPATVAALAHMPATCGDIVRAVDRILAAIAQGEKAEASSLLDAVIEERNQAREQRDAYKRRLDAFEREVRAAEHAAPFRFAMSLDQESWWAFPRGRWTLRGVRLSDGTLALDLAPYKEPTDGR